MYKEKSFNKVIKQICLENNIQYEELSDDWVIKLEKDNCNRFLVGYKFDLNTQATAEICNDKFALYSVLNSNKIPVIEYNILFKNEEEKLKYYFEKYNHNVVIKPNNGTCGCNVKHIIEYNELKTEYENLIRKYYSVNICPFYDIESEYRIIYLPNKQYMYKKVKPIVVGDGNSSVKELLEKFNYEYFSKLENCKNEKIPLDYIPKVDEKIEYEWKFNLSKGAKTDEVTEVEKKELINLLNKIINVIDLKFVSIDIVKMKNNEYMVMEINSGVMMENLIKLKENGFEIAKEIYTEAIRMMFRF